MTPPHFASLALPLTAIGLAFSLGMQDKVTYDDTPLLPDSEYRVHGERPWPEVVQPGSTTVAPSDATVLFDGANLDAWQGRGGEAGWKVENGYAQVNGKGDIRTRAEFGDIQLHLEFQTPSEVKGSSQGRGNSGIYFMGRYEVQILDSFENPSYPDGQCSALYGQTPPLVNACRAPGQWQTYDILFRAPRFEGKELLQPARVTVLHNGVVTQWDQAYIGASTHRKIGKYSPHPPKGPVKIQDHGNPIRFRNIWVREL
ncbi:hypothetical protein CMO84_07270 [Candidatus Woesearchaeota archaeon]|nr:hypothetical protein [Candidatus Woesearchaeota archaeon]